MLGTQKDEGFHNTELRPYIRYGDILLEYALEVLGGKPPTAEETK
jgi:hypothetical protein